MPGQKPYLTLADVYVPGPRRVHPAIKPVAAGVEAFCQTHHIKGRGYNEYTTMTYYLFPDADIERLAAIAMLMNVLYYIDDEVNIENMRHEDLDTRELLQQCLQIFCTGLIPASSHPFFEVWQELHRRFSAVSNPPMMAAIVEALLTYLETSTCSEDALYVDGVLSLERFLEFRLYLSGMYLCTEVMQFARNLRLPDSVLYHTELAEARQHCVFYGAMLNDIFSYHKEINAGNRFNLVNILQETYGMTLDEAIHDIILRLNQSSRQFELIEQDMAAWCEADLVAPVTSYMQGLRDLFVASWHWQISTNRYRSPDSPIKELREYLAIGDLEPAGG